MSYDRRWLDEPHVGDHVGRSVWALGDILATAWIPALVVPTRDLLDRLVGRARRRRLAANGRLHGARSLAPRPRPARRPTRSTLLERLVEQLADAYERTPSTEWHWFEDELSYDNARLSQALIAGGEALGRDGPGRDRARVAALARRRVRARRRARCGCPATTAGAGARPARARATSSRSTPPRSSRRSWPRSRSHDEAEHGVRAHRAFEWFLGRNRLQRPLYDFATGGCSDGLGARGASTATRAPSRRSPSTAPRLVLDAAGVRASDRRVEVEDPPRRQAAASSAPTTSAVSTLAAPTQRSPAP